MTALWNHLDPPRPSVSMWHRNPMRACDWCGRERVRRADRASDTCQDCAPYDKCAQAVEAGEAS